MKTEMMDTKLIENVKNIYRRMSRAAMMVERDPEEVRLVAVTKNVNIERIKKAVDWGLRIFGESKVQEAKEKISNLKSQLNPHLPPFSKGGWGGFEIEWHLVGHLQKNKAKTAIQLFDLIHSLDSIEISKELDKYAEKAKKIQRVLIQVKLSDEETKYGISKEGLTDLIKAVSDMRNLKLEGLMTMAPFFDDPEMARPYFRDLRELRDNFVKSGYKLIELSMGMTHDFEVAIEEGATMVRIGTGIFGEMR